MINFIKKYFFGKVEDTSQPGTLDKVDMFKLLRNAVIYAIGAFLTYLSENLTGVDLGTWTPIVVIIISGMLDAVRKLLKDNGYTN